MIKKLAVYCGAQPGNDPRYTHMAKAFGKEMGLHDIDLVYGGGRFGLMGAVAEGVQDEGHEVYGVITKQLDERGAGLDSLDHLEVVPDMDTRKRRMMELADGLIALPGGYGTIEEVSEAISWINLGNNKKPVAFYNYDGFYDDFQRQLTHMHQEGFVEKQYLDAVCFDDSFERILAFMNNYQAPAHRTYPTNK